MNIVDRRPNPKGKSLPNRQRFLERAKHEIKDAMTEALKRRKVGQNSGGEKVSIPAHRISEPTFHKASQGGTRQYVVPGNKEFVVGDRIKRPLSGSAARGGEASPEDGGERPAGERVAGDEDDGQPEHDHRRPCERGYTAARSGSRGGEHAGHHEK